MGVTVRGLQEGDIEELARIEEESFTMPWSEKIFRDLLTRSYCCYVVAELEGKVVGGCGFTNSCNEANIDNVVVDADFRGRGIARKMLQHLMELGESAGVTAFTLEVRAGNEVAIHMYETLGFHSEGIRPGFYEKPMEDAVIMWRYVTER